MRLFNDAVAAAKQKFSGNKCNIPYSKKIRMIESKPWYLTLPLDNPPRLPEDEVCMLEWILSGLSGRHGETRKFASYDFLLRATHLSKNPNYAKEFRAFYSVQKAFVFEKHAKRFNRTLQVKKSRDSGESMGVAGYYNSYLSDLRDELYPE